MSCVCVHVYVWVAWVFKVKTIHFHMGINKVCLFLHTVPGQGCESVQLWISDMVVTFHMNRWVQQQQCFAAFRKYSKGPHTQPRLKPMTNCLYPTTLLPLVWPLRQKSCIKTRLFFHSQKASLSVSGPYHQMETSNMFFCGRFACLYCLRLMYLKV